MFYSSHKSHTITKHKSQSLLSLHTVHTKSNSGAKYKPPPIGTSKLRQRKELESLRCELGATGSMESPVLCLTVSGTVHRHVAPCALFEASGNARFWDHTLKIEASVDECIVIIRVCITCTGFQHLNPTPRLNKLGLTHCDSNWTGESNGISGACRDIGLLTIPSALFTRLELSAELSVLGAGCLESGVASLCFWCC